MENYKRGDDFFAKLMLVLRKITNSECKMLDNTYLEKLLSHIENEFNNIFEDGQLLTEFSQWLTDTFQTCRVKHLNICVQGFICQLIGILSKKEQGFLFLQKIDAVNQQIDILQPNLFNNNSLKLAYMKLLSCILGHSSGYNWLKSSQQWKVVIRLYYLDSNLYIEREGLAVIKKFISKTTSDEYIFEEILHEVLFPISKNEVKNTENKCLDSKTILTLRLLEEILRVFMFSKNSICSKLEEVFNLELFLKTLLSKCECERILDAASTLYVMFFIVKFENKEELMSMKSIPEDMLDIFYALLRRNYAEGIIKLGKFCQILWNEMRNHFKCEYMIGIHFIIVQLVCVLVYNKKPPDTKLFDLFVQKLFALTSPTTQKLGYAMRDLIRSQSDSKPRDWAVKGVLSAIGNLDSLSQDEAVLIFQTMAYILKMFVPDTGCNEGFIYNDNYEKEMSLCIADASLLSAVLNALCVLIERFKINWNESLESLCLLKVTCNLLQNTQLSSTVVVQTLLLVKYAILNFMSPNLALLLNKTEDSSFECLMPLLYKRMHDPNWEIRDSCIEVVGAIAELAESKYPAFQQLLIEMDFCALVFNIMEGDSESYVRASALRTLSAMIKIEALSQCLVKLDFPPKIIKLLQTESEAIVRREAALLMRQIYLSLNESVDLVNSFYRIMSYTALCDLHWEVKVNSLVFWEAVIESVIADQGMIDGSFPKVTFSKEHKKIVILTSDEIKLRLDKVLRELSKVGCLYVLLSTLNDDCDFMVIKKSAQILTDLINILKRYEVIKPCENFSICDRIPTKRKNSDSSNCEKRKPPSDNDILNENTSDCISEQTVNSDEVIEEIINEMDINLLVSVCQGEEEKRILEKNISLQEIKPESFLMQVQGFDYEKFLADKQKWFANMEVDLKSLVNDIINVETVCETNVMDCY